MGKGRTPCCEKGRVKKGPWSQAEDLRLISFIQTHGHNNWRSLPKLAGLARCGKSCRLRWVNYLRPDVKRGSFSVEEEEAIVRLQSLLGNKWSKIASYLPGRTDNEIKNVWNTHLKKRLARATSSQTNKRFNTDSRRDAISRGVSDYNSEKVVDNFKMSQCNSRAQITTMSPKVDGTVESSGSDSTTRNPNCDMIGIMRKATYDEPNTIDIWDSLMLDAGFVSNQLNYNMNNATFASNNWWPPESSGDPELGAIDKGTTTTTTTTTVINGVFQETLDEQMSKPYQLEVAPCFPNEGLLVMDCNMENYLETMAWSPSPNFYSYLGF